MLSLPRAPLQLLVQTFSPTRTHTRSSPQAYHDPPVSGLGHSVHSVTGPRTISSPVASLRDTPANEPPKQHPDLTVPSAASLDLSYCQIKDPLISLVPIPHLQRPQNLAPTPLTLLTGYPCMIFTSNHTLAHLPRQYTCTAVSSVTGTPDTQASMTYVLHSSC